MQSPEPNRPILSQIVTVFGRFLAAYIFVGLLLLTLLHFQGERGELYTMARPWYGIASIVLPLVMVVSMHARVARIRRERMVIAIFGVALVLLLPSLFTMRAFGTRDLSQILLYVAHINPTEATQLLAVEHRRQVIEILIGYVILLALGLFLLRRIKGFSLALIGLSGLFVANSIPVAFAFLSWGSPSAAAQLIDPQSDVVTPRILRAPDRQMNLILIYFESMEEAIAELSVTREAFAPLEALSAAGLRLRGIGQYPGSNYSAGGIVATQCGVPLLTPSASSFMPASGVRANEMGPVMPNLLCLGDILADQGYRTTFLNGSDLSSYGIEMFLRSHGFEEIISLRDFEAAGRAERRNSWGVEDDVLYERIRQELEELAASGAPFFLSYENVGTHPPDGYLDPSCPPIRSGRQFPRAIACGVNYVIGIIDHVEQLGIAENTVIAIVIDHLMMSSTLNIDLSGYIEPRHNFALILNAGRTGEVRRRASLMDIYPTLLELIGFEIENGQAGMGRSMFTPAPTMVERLGEDTLDAALRLNMPLSRYLWR